MQPEEMDPNDLVGVVKFNGAWRFFGGTVAEWILDYASYDPGFDPSRHDTVFRSNLLTVDESHADQFLVAMAPYELDPSSLERFIRANGSRAWPLSVMVDFDDRLYVNGFAEISLQDYLPPGWRGVEGSPLAYMPAEIRRIWRQS